MAAEAGPSDAVDEGEDEEEFEELQDPPFPEPELKPMLLCDLLGHAAEVDAAALAQESEHIRWVRYAPPRPSEGCFSSCSCHMQPRGLAHTQAVQAAWFCRREHAANLVSQGHVDTRFAWAGLLLLCTSPAVAVCSAAFPDLLVAGLADDPNLVMPGDMYCCVERVTRSSIWNGHDAEAVEAAIQAGAVAILAEAGTDFPEGLIPDSVAVVYADEVDELAARLAAVLYGECRAQQPRARGVHYAGKSAAIQRVARLALRLITAIIAILDDMCQTRCAAALH